MRILKNHVCEQYITASSGFVALLFLETIPECTRTYRRRSHGTTLPGDVLLFTAYFNLRDCLLTVTLSKIIAFIVSAPLPRFTFLSYTLSIQALFHMIYGYKSSLHARRIRIKLFASNQQNLFHPIVLQGNWNNVSP